jgi:hypothetical protein
VLRTFASTSGDAARTAKIVGISAEEVKSEISALLHSNGGSKQPVAAEAALKAPPRAAPAKPKAKKK